MIRLFIFIFVFFVVWRLMYLFTGLGNPFKFHSKEAMLIYLFLTTFFTVVVFAAGYLIWQRLII